MVKLHIQGLSDGAYDIEEKAASKSIPGISNEFFGDIILTGKLQKIGSRYTFRGAARCMAKLICDRSLKEFEEEISAHIEISAIAHARLTDLTDETDSDDNKIISEEDKHIDITRDVREELTVNLPMKRVSPEYADKEFEESFPEYSARYSKRIKKNKGEIDERWEALKKINLNNN